MKPAVIWLTGLSGAGKTTISELLCRRLRERGHRVESLDGDELRRKTPRLGFTKAERDAHVRRAGTLAGEREASGAFVVAALVSPYREAREFARKACRNFVEVYVSTPLAVCEARDPKGLYARARRGELRGFTGIDDPYEPPVRPELELDGSALSAEEAASRILEYLEKASQAPANMPSARPGSPSFK